MLVQRIYSAVEPRRGEWRYSALLIVSLTLLFLVRLYFATQLLPAPVGDSTLFLDPIYNYCRDGKLFSYLVPYDPTGAFRFVWHGPLPPILYRILDRGCSLQSLYDFRLALFFILPLTLFVLVRRGIISNSAWFCISVFCLAAFERVGFRPEHICVILVVVAYVARIKGQTIAEGICWGCVLLSSPISGLLYAILRALSSSVANLKEIPSFLIGALPAVAMVFFLYPFSVADWIGGMELQARIVNSGIEGDIYTYFVRSDFLPLWGVALAILMIAVIASRGYRGLAYVLLLPFIWYFGLRRPTTNYNLLTTVPLLFLLGYPVLSPRWRMVTAATLLVPGIGGLAQQSARDAFSLAAYPDSFHQAQLTIANAIAAGNKIVAAPMFTIFTNPEIGTAADHYLPHAESDGSSNQVLITQDSGSAGTRCPIGTILVSAVPQPPRLLVFKSSSSWAVNVCKYLPPPLH